MQHADELRHLRSGPRPAERPGGVGLVRVAVEADDPVAVLDRVRAVLLAVLGPADQAPAPADVPARLPAWFVAGCADERSDEEGRPWSLEDWLGWFEPGERQWWWWSAEVEDDHHLGVQVEVDGWPFPSGALVRLLRVAGATTVEVEG